MFCPAIEQPARHGIADALASMPFCHDFQHGFGTALKFRLVVVAVGHVDFVLYFPPHEPLRPAYHICGDNGVFRLIGYRTGINQRIPQCVFAGATPHGQLPISGTSPFHPCAVVLRASQRPAHMERSSPRCPCFRFREV